MGCHALLRQGVFLTQRPNQHLLISPALAGRFFITRVTWEALRVNDTGLIRGLLWVVIPCREVSSPLD